MTTLTTQVPRSSILPEFMIRPMFAANLFLLSIFIFSLPFVAYAIFMGMGFLVTGDSVHPFLQTGREGYYDFALYALAAHMVSGAFINLLAPLQIHLGLTQKNKKWHRYLGGAVIAVSFSAAIVGTVFYAFYPDNTGERLMNSPSNLQAGSLFGVTMFIVAYKVVQTLIQRDFQEHRIWAVSLFVLAIGSYTSRVSDGWERLYFSAFGGSADLRTYVMVATAWAFWLVPLAGVHGYYALKRRGAFANVPATTPLIASLIGVGFYGIGTYSYFVSMLSRML
ncbi:MAG: DUF2306 domain-containing protein [Pseudohongiellaceae bacterium]